MKNLYSVSAVRQISLQCTTVTKKVQGVPNLNKKKNERPISAENNQITLFVNTREATLCDRQNISVIWYVAVISINKYVRYSARINILIQYSHRKKQRNLLILPVASTYPLLQS